MAPIKPMLGDFELQQVQRIETEGDQLLVTHRVPGLEGDFLQGLGRRGSRIALTGVATGPESREHLKTIREKFLAADPVPFVSDIATATQVDQVVVEEMEVRELAGKPERSEYALVLREYTPPPAEETEAPPEVDQEIEDEASDMTEDQVEDIAQTVGTLEVEVDLGGGDFSGLFVVVEGETEDGEPFSAWSDEQTDGLYRFDDIHAGNYTVRLEIR